MNKNYEIKSKRRSDVLFPLWEYSRWWWVWTQGPPPPVGSRHAIGHAKTTRSFVRRCFLVLNGVAMVLYRIPDGRLLPSIVHVSHVQTMVRITWKCKLVRRTAIIVFNSITRPPTRRKIIGDFRCAYAARKTIMQIRIKETGAF